MIKLFGPFQKNCNEPGIFELETVRLTKRPEHRRLQSVQRLSRLTTD